MECKRLFPLHSAREEEVRHQHVGDLLQLFGVQSRPGMIAPLNLPRG